MNNNTYSLVKQITRGLNEQLFVPLQLKTGSFLLLNNFLNIITSQEKKDYKSIKSLHFNAIIEVEKKLNNSILSRHQSNTKIKNLAEEFNMSVSTLRRHFKIVFGQNIYEYSQKKKMMWAKIQLEKGEQNIKEIACALDLKNLPIFRQLSKRSLVFFRVR
ncbi:MAG: AraC family transcriptional regulator [Ginsengibacter sp.]